MPRKVSDYWRREAFALLDEGDTPAQVEAKLGTRGDAPKDVGPPPAERTIRGWKPTDEEQRLDRFVRWPESMGTSDLPWEASRSILRLLRIYLTDGDRRPTVRAARWYWRLNQAGGDMNVNVVMAGVLAMHEQTSGAIPERVLRELEGVSAFRAWEEDDDSESTSSGFSAHARAVERRVIPPLTDLFEDTDVPADPEQRQRASEELAPILDRDGRDVSASIAGLEDSGD